MKSDAPAVKRELVWPEIKDPQALIDFAKAEIAKVKTKNVGFDQFHLTADSPLAYLRPLWSEVNVDGYVLYITFDTHPQTGQGLLIFPNAKDNGNKPTPFLAMERDSLMSPEIIDTAIPEIKQVVLKHPGVAGDLGWWAKSSVRWKKIENLDQARGTSPLPLTMQLPEYPTVMLRYGMDGETKLDFTVTELGTVSNLTIKASQPEFEKTTRDAAIKWRFEPGVDLQTRRPMAVRISLMVKFKIDDD